MPLHVAFWNVENLFDPGADVGRGPAGREELDAKVGVLTGVLTDLFDGAGPDLLGLAEVGDGRLFARVVDGLPGDYLRVWEPAFRRNHTGLGVAVRLPACTAVERVAAYRAGLLAARPRFLAVRVVLRGDGRPLLFVVNHWKSRMPVPGDPDADARDRVDTGRALGDLLATDDSADGGAVVLGDFNDEPSDPPFGEGLLRAGRTFSSALWSGATPAYLYNTGWRFLAPPDPWEVAAEPGYREPRPRGSHTGGDLFDHLLVSGRLLRGGPLRLVERSVTYAATDRTALHRRSGRLVPRRWRYDGPDEFSGSSDHFPLTATFARTPSGGSHA